MIPIELYGKRYEVEFLTSRFGETAEICQVLKDGSRRYFKSEDKRMIEVIAAAKEKKGRS